MRVKQVGQLIHARARKMFFAKSAPITLIFRGTLPSPVVD